MNWEEIRKEFEETDITMKDLAEKHDVKSSTLRSRKNREKWTKKNATQQKKNVATHDATQRKNVATQKVVEEIQDDSELTEKQKLFCLNYSQNHNATKSYQMAYEVDYKTAHANSYRLMAKDGIRAEIKRIKEARADDWLINDMDIVNEYMKQAFADINDIVKVQLTEHHLNDKNGHKLIDIDGNMLTGHFNEVYVNSSEDFDGTLVRKISQGKDGISVELYDKQKAFQELLKLMSDGGSSAGKQITIVNPWGEAYGPSED